MVKKLKQNRGLAGRFSGVGSFCCKQYIVMRLYAFFALFLRENIKKFVYFNSCICA